MTSIKIPKILGEISTSFVLISKILVQICKMTAQILKLLIKIPKRWFQPEISCTKFWRSFHYSLKLPCTCKSLKSQKSLIFVVKYVIFWQNSLRCGTKSLRFNKNLRHFNSKLWDLYANLCDFDQFHCVFAWNFRGLARHNWDFCQHFWFLDLKECSIWRRHLYALCRNC